MRVLLTTTGHAGHVLPLVPLARACLRAGHEVRVAVPASRSGDVINAGLHSLPLADPPEDESWPVLESSLDVSPDEANRRVIGEIFGRINTTAALPGVLGIVEAWRPDVIVRESYELAGLLAAELRGIPHVRAAVGLALMEEQVRAYVTGSLDRLRAELDLSSDPDGDSLSSPYLTLTPPSLEDPRFRVPAAPHRFRDPQAAAARPLPDWWPGNRDPLVYVSFGSVAAGVGFFPALYAEAAAALAEMPIRVLMTLGHGPDPNELGPLPDNVHVEAWVAQADVAAEASVIVGHGGYGSTLGALAAGVPLAVLPLFADQPYNARRVAEAGAGVVAAPARPLSQSLADPAGNGAAVARSVQQLLESPRHREAAADIAAEIDSLPAVDAAVGVLESAAREALAVA